MEKFGEASGPKEAKMVYDGDETNLKLKDFYFAYKRRPFLFRRKKLTQADEDILSLNISKLSIPKGTVFVSTHDPELIELCCDHVLTISNGKVFSLVDKTGAV